MVHVIVQNEKSHDLTFASLEAQGSFWYTSVQVQRPENQRITRVSPRVNGLEPSVSKGKKRRTFQFVNGK